VAVFQAVRRDRKRAVLGTLAAITLLTALALAISEASTDDEPTAAATERTASSAEPVLAAESQAASTELTEEVASASRAEFEPPGAPVASAIPAQPEAQGETQAAKPSHRHRRHRPSQSEESGGDKPGFKKPKLADSPYVTPKSPD
jgi:hypothetical protein